MKPTTTYEAKFTMDCKLLGSQLGLGLSPQVVWLPSLRQPGSRSKITINYQSEVTKRAEFVQKGSIIARILRLA